MRICSQADGKQLVVCIDNRGNEASLEQLLGRNIETGIEKWYRGVVRFVIELRPGSVIKDDAVSKLLRKRNRPTFVTIKKGENYAETL